MPLLILSAIGGVAQTVKYLYDFYALHSKNQDLLNILSGFSKNLGTTIERLSDREELLDSEGKAEGNLALQNIGKDFQEGLNWLRDNEVNLKSRWTAIQSAEKLKNLDIKLTKSFASNISIAILSSLQESRSTGYKIQSTLKRLSGNLEEVVREASRESLKEAIDVLKEEAFLVKNSGGEGKDGFTSGEAEKIISQLVDQLSAQEILLEQQEDDESKPYFYPSSETSLSTSTPTRSNVSTGRTSVFSNTGEENPYPNFSKSYPPNPPSSTSSSRINQAESTRTIPQGSIIYNALDFSTSKPLIDPVLGDDGNIHDRFVLIDNRITHLNDPTRVVVIQGNLNQLQSQFFFAYPTRIQECKTLRESFESQTLQSYESSTLPFNTPHLIDSISHIILWSSETDSIAWLVRRGILRYRVRDLEGALEDFENVVEISEIDSQEDKKGKGRESENKIRKGEGWSEAMRMKAVIQEEIHDTELSLESIRSILRLSPNDILMLSLRASIRASSDDLIGATKDLKEVDEILKEGEGWKSSLIEGRGGGGEDFNFIARGFAYLNILDYEAAENNFNIAVSIRSDPYSLACRGLARIKGNYKSEEGWKDLNTSIRQCSEFASNFMTNNRNSSKKLSARKKVKLSSGLTLPLLKEEMGYPIFAYSCFFLRGIAYFTTNQFPEALSDLLVAISLRPRLIKEQSELHYLLAQIKFELGDKEGAKRDFELALGFSEGEKGRFVFERGREGCL